MNDETDEFGFLTKKSRFYYLWENYIAVSRLLFENLLGKTDNSFQQNCEELLKCFFNAPADPLVTDMILKLYVRFTPLFYLKQDALNGTLSKIFDTFNAFQITERVQNSNSAALKNIIVVRKSAVHALIGLSLTLKKQLIPLFDSLSAQAQIPKSGEDLSGLLEFLLTVVDDEATSRKRTEMIANNLNEALNALVSPQISQFFDARGLLSLLQPTGESARARHILRTSLNTVNTLLRAATHCPDAKSPAAATARDASLAVLLLTAFQFDELWAAAKGALPALLRLCRAQNELREPSLAVTLGIELRVALFSPEQSAALSRRLRAEGAEEREQWFRAAGNWVADLREVSCATVGLCCSLSDSFFAMDPGLVMSALFCHLPNQDMRSLKVMVDKLITPFTLRCVAAVPQYAGDFLAPLLSAFFAQLETRLIFEWQKFDALQVPRAEDRETLEAQTHFQEELFHLTRGVSKLFLSLSLDLALRSAHDLRTAAQKPQKHKKGPGAGGARLNRFAYAFLFQTERVAGPMAALLALLVGVGDAAARANVFRFLGRVAAILRPPPPVVSDLLARALSNLPHVGAVDDGLAEFAMDFAKSLSEGMAALRNRSGEVVSEADFEYWAAAFEGGGDGEASQRKRTKVFLMKIAGEDVSELRRRQ